MEFFMCCSAQLENNAGHNCDSVVYSIVDLLDSRIQH